MSRANALGLVMLLAALAMVVVGLASIHWGLGLAGAGAMTFVVGLLFATSEPPPGT